MNLRSIVRASAPIALAATAGLVLSACGSSSDSSSKPSASASPSASATPTQAPVSTTDACALKAGPASNAVTVTGTLGKTPKITVKGVIKATTVERTVVITGSGALVAEGDKVVSHLSLFRSNGKKIIDQDAQVPINNTVSPVFLDALTCLKFGSRVVVAAPASAVYSDTQMPSDIKSTDTLIIVSDVLKKFTVPAPPKPAAWTQNVPTVTFDAAGKPTVKLNGSPISNFALKVLRAGTGEVVQSGDNVTVNYQGTNWDTGKIFDQSYGGQPATFNTTQVVKGFGGALVGQKVGTRLVVTIPPALGYGAKASKSSPLAGKTLVFVVEIIKTAR